MNHENLLKKCSYFPKDRRRLCYDLPSRLPGASLAKLDHFPSKRRVEVQETQATQKIYMDASQDSLFPILDEMNSYTLSTQVFNDMLKKNGLTAIFDDKLRPIISLPLFMVYASLYLEKLNSQNPSLFKKYFGPGSDNIKSIQTLLDEADVTYSEWVTLLRINKQPEFEIESGLFSEYRQIRHNLEANHILEKMTDGNRSL